MTITSVGYRGTVGEAQWAAMITRVGGVFYAVNDHTSFKVSIGAGTRTVAIAAGGASCTGIYDTSNAVETKTLAAVSSGTRWDMVVLRRTWATPVTTLEVIQGGSSKALPARNQTSGVVVDQPLALVRVVAGSTAIQEIVDLRCVAVNGSLLAFDTLARSYLSPVATSVRIGDIQWTRTVDATGSPVWTYVDVTPDTGWVDITRNPGWTWGFAQARRIGADISVRIAAVRNVGWVVGNGVASLPAQFRPDARWYVISSSTAGKTEFVFETNGDVNASQDSIGSTAATIHTHFPAARPI